MEGAKDHHMTPEEFRKWGHVAVDFLRRANPH